MSLVAMDSHTSTWNTRFLTDWYAEETENIELRVSIATGCI